MLDSCIVMMQRRGAGNPVIIVDFQGQRSVGLLLLTQYVQFARQGVVLATISCRSGVKSAVHAHF
jgi:hypothetical protein